MDQIFALFFAIFWGGILSVAGRWKMFQPLVDRRVVSRVLLSVFWMMVLPIAYFAWQFGALSAYRSPSFWEVVSAVLPAAGIFACYRFWMACVLQCPRCFYWSNEESPPDLRLRDVDVSVEELKLENGYGGLPNFWAGIAYALVALVGPLVLKGGGLT